MAVLLMPLGNSAPFVDENGDPASGYLLYFYTAGSSTPQDTYTTYLGNVQNANPVVLGSGGYPTVSNAVVEIWGTAGVQYKAVLKTAAGVTVWTRDYLQLINDTTVSVSEWVSGPTPTYIGATSFSLVGDQTSTFQVGRRVKTTNSGGTVYSTITASAYTSLTTVTVRNDSGTLDAGLSAVSYGLLSATNNAIPVYSEAKRAFVGVYTAWDPSSTGVLTSPGTSSFASSSTATDYLTVVLASGTATLTCVKAGVYRFLVDSQNESTASSTSFDMRATLGGTATPMLGAPTLLMLAEVENNGGFPIPGARSFYASMTAGQTVTILPKLTVSSGNAMTNFTQQCTISAEYTGTT